MTFASESARVGREPFSFIEIDLDFCQLTYGVAPCTAELGSDGTQKCFNTFPSCQDPDNYDPAPKTYRFCENIARLPKGLDAFPFLKSVSLTPTKLAIGSGLGERAKVTVTLVDAPHHDRGVDPYVDERPYNPMLQGTFWGKFCSRNRYYLGRQLRVFTGYLTEDEKGAPVYDASNFEVRYFFLERIDPPDSGGRVTITAKDLLKFADDDRAKAPRPAKGRLAAGIAAGDISATLEPSGIGDLEYSAAGVLRINNELMNFTRSADTLTLERGQYNSAAAAHAEDDAVQECYVAGDTSAGGEQLQDIMYDLLVNYANIPASYIDKPAWDEEASTYLTRLYSAIISAPVGVNQLLNELCEQGPAYLWWDEKGNKIVFRALRPASSASTSLSDERNFLAGSIKAIDKPDERVSQVHVYFGQRTFTEALEKPSNYKQLLVAVGDSEGANKQGQPKVRTVFCRWISEFGRTFAQEIAAAILQRYNETPKLITFALDPKDSALGTGDLFIGLTRLAQDDDGGRKSITYQVTQARERYGAARYDYEALEERYSPSATVGQRIVVIDGDTLDFNLRNAHDTLYAAPTGAVEVLCIIDSGSVVGSSSVATPAFEVGDWPAGSTITITWNGRVQGRGGRGGGFDGSAQGRHGEVGGPAFYTRFPITINYGASAEVWGGGGGGGAQAPESIVQPGGGGGGAGELPGAGGESRSNIGTPAYGEAGSRTAGGRGGYELVVGGQWVGVGHGGGPGLAGANGPPPPNGWSGGAGAGPGAAIDGASFITSSGSPDIRGAQIN
jgi:hypothetical protein